MDTTTNTTTTTDEMARTVALLVEWLNNSRVNWAEAERVSVKMSNERRDAKGRITLGIVTVVALLVQGETREAQEVVSALALFAALTLSEESWGVVWQLQQCAVRGVTSRAALLVALM
jgi:hypothetical protein